MIGIGLELVFIRDPSRRQQREFVSRPGFSKPERRTRATNPMADLRPGGPDHQLAPGAEQGGKGLGYDQRFDHDAVMGGLEAVSFGDADS
jgi:hypothetical protein